MGIDAADVEVYGGRRSAVAYNYQGERAGRRRVASQAGGENPLAAGLLASDYKVPLAHVDGLLGRALAPACRGPSTTQRRRQAAGARWAPMPGFFSQELAHAAGQREDMAFTIQARSRSPACGRSTSPRLPTMARRDTIDMDERTVAVSPYRTADLARRRIFVLIHPVKLDPDEVSARSPVARPPPHPAPRSSGPCSFPELEKRQGPYFAYSFIYTNLDLLPPGHSSSEER